ncbi:hypothetical protein K402DRAFT_425764 [Aulographum hederae CBS 113979]|uniref:Meiotically up-regulated protein Msb1/Mug8 domain-containing protein n=1 Tax=Aulographum hederae CBS 113979 TaxID=1176131 RepID=A0A6G1GJ91_9PEZI|nr:hypothetical protein K402DRAFT_425764 [Aulographum hederae CBS 113979]
MPFFSRVFGNKDSKAASKAKKGAAQDNGGPVAPRKLKWEDAWSRKDVAPEEIQELVHECTQEMKSRALDTPFLLLPFRPGSDASASRSFVRNYFRSLYETGDRHYGRGLQQELRLTEPIDLCSIMKWCWSRLPGGVVTWDAYELFRIGELDSNMARHAFDTFIPLSVDSTARKQIIFDFFDLLAAVAARGRTNGLGGRKLSRMAGWWAFEHSDNGTGFDGGYKSWAKAADATSHLFFAYLRSLSPDSVTGVNGISAIPRSLQSLLSQTEYPPEAPTLMQNSTTRVVMIVKAVSPTPFALLRRAKNFEYRDDDRALQEYSQFEDPVKALTDECRRVLKSISAINAHPSSVTTEEPAGGNGVQDASWSRFEDMGFGNMSGGSAIPENTPGQAGRNSGMRTGAESMADDFGRPTTPSWADFLSTGFPENESSTAATLPVLLPPDKMLPAIGERAQSSQSHVRPNDFSDDNLEPGELASVTRFDLDETFWWVWMTSLAAEETPERKAAFGRCALIETTVAGASWLVVEEQVKGASPGQDEGVYIAEKKSRFSFTRRGRNKSKTVKQKKKAASVKEPYHRDTSSTPASRSGIGSDQHARIQAAAAQLKRKDVKVEDANARRARMDEAASMKTNSVMTLQPMIMSEAEPAMKWAKEFDKGTIRAQYMNNKTAGTGKPVPEPGMNGSSAHLSPSTPMSRKLSNGELPALPPSEAAPEPPKANPVTPPAPVPPTPVADVSSPGSPTPVAKVPLPADAYDEKPPIDNSEQHPALRKPVPVPQRDSSVEQEYPESPETAAPEPTMPDAEPAPTKDTKEAKKIKKAQGGGGGFKKLFAKKDKADRSSKAPPSASSGLQVPSTKPERRLSLLRKKVPESARSETPAPAPAVESEPMKDEPAAAEPTLDMAVDTPNHADQTYLSYTNGHHHQDDRPSTVGTIEQQEANREFSRFAEGPLEDQPVFVPEDSPPASERAPSPSPEPRMKSPAMPASSSQKSPPGTANAYASSFDSDTTPRASSKPEVVSPAEPNTERWAQIRKNAAERAARMGYEDQALRQRHRSESGGNKTDDGETSGEETIEARVARIKARVAELTGNMESQTSLSASAAPKA